MPQLHGSMTLVERHRTIYFRAENSYVAEQERYIKPGTLQLSLQRGRRACAQQVCQLFEPAQNACAECLRCARVAGERRSRRAAEIKLLLNYALNVSTTSPQEAVVQLESSRACRRTGQKAGGACG